MSGWFKEKKKDDNDVLSSIQEFVSQLNDGADDGALKSIHVDDQGKPSNDADNQDDAGLGGKNDRLQESTTEEPDREISEPKLSHPNSSTGFNADVLKKFGAVGTVAKKSARLAAKGIGFMTRNGQLCHATPVPPYSDVAELEYISSLHQCSNVQAINQDGSVSAEEIATFLKSRHGLHLRVETVRNIVLGGLTADLFDESDMKAGKYTEKDKQATMDLVELTSTLIIPNLLRLRRMRTERNKEETYLPESESQCPECREVKAEDTAEKGDDVGHVDHNEQTKQGPGVEVFNQVLSLILVDVTGSAEPKPINEKLVRDILLFYGEETLARDEQLVSEMVECASGSTISLDTDAFVEGLTSDVERSYDPEREVRVSTNFQDVFHHVDACDEESMKEAISFHLHEETLSEKCLKALKGMKQRRYEQRTHNENDEIEVTGRGGHNESQKYEYERLFTAPAIDYAADTYRTRVHGVIVWIAFVAFYFVYLSFSPTKTHQVDICDEENKDFVSIVVCPFISGTVNALLVVVTLIIFGTPFVSLGSIGNGIEGRESAVQMVIGIVSVLLFLFVPFYVRIDVEDFVSTNDKRSFRIIALVCGLLVTVLQLFHLLMLYIRHHPTHHKWYDWFYSAGNVKYESQIKKAAMFKVDQMLASALTLHRDSLKLACNCNTTKCKKIESQKQTNYGRALFEYSKLDGVMTRIGGIRFTWGRLWDGTLFSEDGIWISNRLVLGTVFQFICCCATPFAAVLGITWVLTRLEERAGEDVNLDATNILVRLAIGLGATAGFFTAVYMTIVFMPTMVSTTLKFRRGVIPSMRSRAFLRYRFALDQVTLMYGGMFWGVIVSAAAVAMIVGTIVFLFGWETSSAFMWALTGNYLGLGLVAVIKIVVLQLLRNKFFAAFYRRSPLAGNLVTMALECYSVAISIYFMVVRAVKILILGAMYVGRIDTPLFADGVGIFGPIEIDNWPSVTRKEILLHEAHRHPYLEQLGYLYLMQLRYKDGRFATRSCSAWRLVFVMALMPWLHKFRELVRPEDVGELDNDDGVRFRSLSRCLAVLPNDPSGLLMKHAASRNVTTSQSCISFDDGFGSEKRERIAAIQAELHRLHNVTQRLQNELRELDDD